jgi:hypothetical protein
MLHTSCDVPTGRGSNLTTCRPFPCRVRRRSDACPGVPAGVGFDATDRRGTAPAKQQIQSGHEEASKRPHRSPRGDTSYPPSLGPAQAHSRLCRRGSSPRAENATGRAGGGVNHAAVRNVLAPARQHRHGQEAVLQAPKHAVVRRVARTKIWATQVNGDDVLVICGRRGFPLCARPPLPHRLSLPLG